MVMVRVEDESSCALPMSIPLASVESKLPSICIEVYEFISSKGQIRKARPAVSIPAQDI